MKKFQKKKKLLLTREEKEHDRKISCIVSFIIVCIAMVGLMIDFYDPEPLIPNFSEMIFHSFGDYNDQQYTNEYYIVGDPIKHPENKLSGSWFMMIFIMMFPLVANLVGYDKEGKKIDKEKIKRGYAVISKFVRENATLHN